nr:activating signal cointegrator 1 complex subunit 2 homolog isoform X1 [Penaeus vannamei]
MRVAHTRAEERLIRGARGGGRAVWCCWSSSFRVSPALSTPSLRRARMPVSGKQSSPEPEYRLVRHARFRTSDSTVGMKHEPVSSQDLVLARLDALFTDIKAKQEEDYIRRHSYIDSSGCSEHKKGAAGDRRGSIGDRRLSSGDRRGSLGERGAAPRRRRQARQHQQPGRPPRQPQRRARAAREPRLRDGPPRQLQQPDGPPEQPQRRRRPTGEHRRPERPTGELEHPGRAPRQPQRLRARHAPGKHQRLRRQWHRRAAQQCQRWRQARQSERRPGNQDLSEEGPGLPEGLAPAGGGLPASLSPPRQRPCRQQHRPVEAALCWHSRCGRRAAPLKGRERKPARTPW